MRFVSAIRVFLVLLVAVLMPLEHARCACAEMSAEPEAVPAAMLPAAESVHPCCAAKASRTQTADARQGCEEQDAQHSCNSGHCSCSLTTAESPAPVVVASAPESAQFAPLALAALVSLFAPDAPVVSTDPAPDVGSPPTAAPTLAHGLRAPPAIA